MKQEYAPIPFKDTDDRIFILKNDKILMQSVSMEFTQLDILQIMRHLKGRNDRLYQKLKRCIMDCDEREHTKTDFSRRLPQRRYNGELY